MFCITFTDWRMDFCVVCMTFTDWFRGRTSVWFVLLLLIGLEEGLLCGLYYFY